MSLKNNKPVKYYDSNSQISHLGYFIKEMVSDLLSSKELAYTLMKRDIKSIYRQSLLGFTWALIPSLVTALTFTLASQNDILNIGSTDLPYPVYILFGITIWQTFSESVLGPINSLASAKGFVTKINFPKEALFLAKIGEIIFNFFIKTILLILVCILYKAVPTEGILFSPLIIIVTIILGTSIGLALAPFGMIYQDLTKGLPLILGLGMFLTPVVYPLPSPGGIMSKIVLNNPVTYLVIAFRDLTFEGAVEFGQKLLSIGLISILMFVVGWFIYRISLPYVIERS